MTRKPYSIRARIISSLVVLVFSWDAVVWSGTVLPPASTSSSEVSTAGTSSSIDFHVPPDLAVLEEMEWGAGEGKTPFVIHIQTAHGSHEAAKKIQALLEHFTKEYGTELILLEGAAGRLDARLDRYFRNSKWNRQILEYRAQQGQASGVSLFLLDASDAIQAWGVEAPAAYRKNRKAFQEAFHAQEIAQGALDELNREVGNHVSRLARPLRDFLEHREAFERDQASPLVYFRSLHQTARKTMGLNLGRPEAQREWPNLARLARLEKIEGLLDRRQAEEEKELFLKEIRRFVPASLHAELKGFLDTPSHRPEGHVRFLLERVVDALPASYRFERFSALLNYLQLAAYQNEIRGSGLFEELERLADQVGDALSEGREEPKEILRLVKNYQLLKRLLALELTPRDYERIEAGIKNAVKIVPQRLEPLCEKAVEFYRGAKERERWMAENVAKKAADSKRPVILITGGFHTAGLVEFFKSRGWSFAGLTPRLAETSTRQGYLDSILEKHPPLFAQAAVEDALAYTGLPPALLKRLGVDPSVARELRIRDLLFSDIPLDLSSLKEINESEAARQFGFRLARKKSHLLVQEGIRTHLIDPARRQLIQTLSRAEVRAEDIPILLPAKWRSLSPEAQEYVRQFKTRPYVGRNFWKSDPQETPDKYEAHRYLIQELAEAVGKTEGNLGAIDFTRLIKAFNWKTLSGVAGGRTNTKSVKALKKKFSIPDTYSYRKRPPVQPPWVEKTTDWKGVQEVFASFSWPELQNLPRSKEQFFASLRRESGSISKKTFHQLNSALSRLVQQGNAPAREAMLNLNERLLFFDPMVRNAMRDNEVEWALRAVLARAVELWRPERGARFSTYASRALKYKVMALRRTAARQRSRDQRLRLRETQASPPPQRKSAFLPLDPDELFKALQPVFEKVRRDIKEDPNIPHHRPRILRKLDRNFHLFVDRLTGLTFKQLKERYRFRSRQGAHDAFQRVKERLLPYYGEIEEIVSELSSRAEVRREEGKGEGLKRNRKEWIDLNGNVSAHAGGRANPEIPRRQLRSIGQSPLRIPSTSHSSPQPPSPVHPEDHKISAGHKYTPQENHGQGTFGIENKRSEGNREEAQQGAPRILPLLERQFEHGGYAIKNMRNSQVLISGRRAEVRMTPGELPEYVVSFLAEEFSLALETLSSAERQTLERHAPFLKRIYDLAAWRGEHLAGLKAVLRKEHLHSPAEFEKVIIQSELFQTANLEGRSLEILAAFVARMEPLPRSQSTFVDRIREVLTRDRSWAVLFYAVTALEHLGDAAIPPLVEFAMPYMEGEIRRKAAGALGRNQSKAAQWLVNRIVTTKDETVRQYLSEIVDQLGELEPKALKLFIGRYGHVHERLIKLLKDYRPSFSELMTSTLFIPRGQSGRKRYLDDRLSEIERFRRFLGEKTFLAILKDWGLASVSRWAQRKDLEGQRELFELLGSLRRENPERPVLVEAIETAQERNDPEFIRSLLLLILGGVKKGLGVRGLLHLIQKNPSQYANVMAFLIAALKLELIVFREDEFIQEEISELLNSDIEPVYYFARKLAKTIPHPSSTGAAEREIKIRDISTQLDEMEARGNSLFRYLRLKIHRDPNSADAEMVRGVIDALLKISHPNVALRIKKDDLDTVLGPFVKSEAKAAVYEAMDLPLGHEIGTALHRELVDWEDIKASPEFFLFHSPQWKSVSEEKKSSPAFHAAKLLVDLYQALNHRYGEAKGYLSSEEIAKHGGRLGAIHYLHQMRKELKKEILTPTELAPHKAIYQKRHQAIVEWGFLLFGFWGRYSEAKFNTFEKDRILEASEEFLHDQFLKEDFRKLRASIEEWTKSVVAPAAPPTGPPSERTLLDEPARPPFLSLLKGLSSLIDKMDLDGLANPRLIRLKQILNQKSLDLQQIDNVLALMQEEEIRLYDFFNFTFGEYPKQQALTLGRRGVLPRYLKEGEESLADEVWAQRVQETLLGDLLAEERSLVLLRRYLEGIRDVLKQLEPWRFHYLELPPASDSSPMLVTQENFHPEITSSVEIGLKAFELFRLKAAGFPVPALDTLPADLPNRRIRLNPQDPRFRALVLEGILQLEKETGKIFPFDERFLSEMERNRIQEFQRTHNLSHPNGILFLSVRSGSFYSMPGLLDTMLNLPFTKSVNRRLRARGENDVFVYDLHRRFLSSYGTVHYGMEQRVFSDLIDAAKLQIAKRSPRRRPDEITIQEFTLNQWRGIVRRFHNEIRKRHPDFNPVDPFRQVLDGVIDVYESWQKSDAKVFRKQFGVSERWGTSATLQEMFFGNRDADSGTGVIFSRDPVSGMQTSVGDWKPLAQGTELVAGLTGESQPLSRLQGQPGSLEETQPGLFHEIRKIALRLDSLEREPQDIEMTRESGKLKVLQTRPLVLTGKVVQKKLQPTGRVRIAGRGIAVSPNAAVGRLLDARYLTFNEVKEEARRLKQRMVEAGEEDLDVLLLFDYATDQDSIKLSIPEVGGAINAKIGRSTHAALVARRLGKALVSDVDTLEFNQKEGTVSLGGREIGFGMEGPIVSIDAYPPTQSSTSGLVIWGAVPVDYWVPRGVRAEVRGQKYLLLPFEEAKRLSERGNSIAGYYTGAKAVSFEEEMEEWLSGAWISKEKGISAKDWVTDFSQDFENFITAAPNVEPATLFDSVYERVEGHVRAHESDALPWPGCCAEAGYLSYLAFRLIDAKLGRIFGEPLSPQAYLYLFGDSFIHIHNRLLADAWVFDPVVRLFSQSGGFEGIMEKSVASPRAEVRTEEGPLWNNPQSPAFDRRLSRKRFRQAFNVLRGRIKKTPLVKAERLSQLAGKPVFVKDDARQIGGSFKIRGVYFEVHSAVQKILENPDLALPALKKGLRIVTQSTGNHGIAMIRSVTWDGRDLSEKYQGRPGWAEAIRRIEPVVFTLKNLPGVKRRDMAAALGEYRRQTESERGAVLDSFSTYEEALWARTAYMDEHKDHVLYIDHGGRAIMLGHGSAGIEIAEQLKAAGIDGTKKVVLIFPAGAGGPIGIAAALKTFRKNTQAVMVQSHHWDAFVRTLQTGRIQKNVTSGEAGEEEFVFADGIAVVGPEPKAVSMARAYVDAAVSVDERKALEGSGVLLLADLAARDLQPETVRVGGTSALAAEALLSHGGAIQAIRNADVVVLFATEGNVADAVSTRLRSRLEDLPAITDSYRRAEVRSGEGQQLLKGVSRTGVFQTVALADTFRRLPEKEINPYLGRLAWNDPRVIDINGRLDKVLHHLASRKEPLSVDLPDQQIKFRIDPSQVAAAIEDGLAPLAIRLDEDEEKVLQLESVELVLTETHQPFLAAELKTSDVTRAGHFTSWDEPVPAGSYRVAVQLVAADEGETPASLRIYVPRALFQKDSALKEEAIADAILGEVAAEITRRILIQRPSTPQSAALQAEGVRFAYESEALKNFREDEERKWTERLTSTGYQRVHLTEPGIAGVLFSFPHRIVEFLAIFDSLVKEWSQRSDASGWGIAMTPEVESFASLILTSLATGMARDRVSVEMLQRYLRHRVLRYIKNIKNRSTYSHDPKESTIRIGAHLFNRRESEEDGKRFDSFMRRKGEPLRQAYGFDEQKIRNYYWRLKWLGRLRSEHAHFVDSLWIDRLKVFGIESPSRYRELREVQDHLAHLTIFFLPFGPKDELPISEMELKQLEEGVAAEFNIPWENLGHQRAVDLLKPLMAHLWKWVAREQLSPNDIYQILLWFKIVWLTEQDTRKTRGLFLRSKTSHKFFGRLERYLLWRLSNPEPWHDPSVKKSFTQLLREIKWINDYRKKHNAHFPPMTPYNRSEIRGILSDVLGLAATNYDSFTRSFRAEVRAGKEIFKIAAAWTGGFAVLNLAAWIVPFLRPAVAAFWQMPLLFTFISAGFYLLVPFTGSLLRPFYNRTIPVPHELKEDMRKNWLSTFWQRGFIPPFVEEPLFRGLLPAAVSRILGGDIPWLAGFEPGTLSVANVASLAVASLGFALADRLVNGPNRGPVGIFHFVLGMSLGMAYLVTGSLMAPILVHVFNNTVYLAWLRYDAVKEAAKTPPFRRRAEVRSGTPSDKLKAWVRRSGFAPRTVLAPAHSKDRETIRFLTDLFPSLEKIILVDPDYGRFASVARGLALNWLDEGGFKIVRQPKNLDSLIAGISFRIKVKITGKVTPVEIVLRSQKYEEFRRRKNQTPIDLTLVKYPGWGGELAQEEWFWEKVISDTRPGGIVMVNNAQLVEGVMKDGLELILKTKDRGVGGDWQPLGWNEWAVFRKKTSPRAEGRGKPILRSFKAVAEFVNQEVPQAGMVSIDGLAGSGKTYSSLAIARRLRQMGRGVEIKHLDDLLFPESERMEKVREVIQKGEPYEEDWRFFDGVRILEMLEGITTSLKDHPNKIVIVEGTYANRFASYFNLRLRMRKNRDLAKRQFEQNMLQRAPHLVRETIEFYDLGLVPSSEKYQGETLDTIDAFIRVKGAAPSRAEVRSEESGDFVKRIEGIVRRGEGMSEKEFREEAAWLFSHVLPENKKNLSDSDGKAFDLAERHRLAWHKQSVGSKVTPQRSKKGAAASQIKIPKYAELQEVYQQIVKNPERPLDAGTKTLLIDFAAAILRSRKAPPPPFEWAMGQVPIMDVEARLDLDAMQKKFRELFIAVEWRSEFYSWPPRLYVGTERGIVPRDEKIQFYVNPFLVAKSAGLAGERTLERFAALLLDRVNPIVQIKVLQPSGPGEPPALIVRLKEKPDNEESAVLPLFLLKERLPNFPEVEGGTREEFLKRYFVMDPGTLNALTFGSRTPLEEKGEKMKELFMKHVAGGKVLAFDHYSLFSEEGVRRFSDFIKANDEEGEAIRFLHLRRLLAWNRFFEGGWIAAPLSEKEIAQKEEKLVQKFRAWEAEENLAIQQEEKRQREAEEKQKALAALFHRFGVPPEEGEGNAALLAAAEKLRGKQVLLNRLESIQIDKRSFLAPWIRLFFHRRPEGGPLIPEKNQVHVLNRLDKFRSQSKKLSFDALFDKIRKELPEELKGAFDFEVLRAFLEALETGANEDPGIPLLREGLLAAAGAEWNTDLSLTPTASGFREKERQDLQQKGVELEETLWSLLLSPPEESYIPEMEKAAQAVEELSERLSRIPPVVDPARLPRLRLTSQADFESDLVQLKEFIKSVSEEVRAFEAVVQGERARPVLPAMLIKLRPLLEGKRYEEFLSQVKLAAEAVEKSSPEIKEGFALLINGVKEKFAEARYLEAEQLEEKKDYAGALSLIEKAEAVAGDPLGLFKDKKASLKKTLSSLKPGLPVALIEEAKSLLFQMSKEKNRIGHEFLTAIATNNQQAIQMKLEKSLKRSFKSEEQTPSNIDYRVYLFAQRVSEALKPDDSSRRAEVRSRLNGRDGGFVSVPANRDNLRLSPLSRAASLTYRELSGRPRLISSLSINPDDSLLFHKTSQDPSRQDGIAGVRKHLIQGLLLSPAQLDSLKNHSSKRPILQGNNRVSSKPVNRVSDPVGSRRAEARSEKEKPGEDPDFGPDVIPGFKVLKVKKWMSAKEIRKISGEKYKRSHGISPTRGSRYGKSLHIDLLKALLKNPDLHLPFDDRLTGTEILILGAGMGISKEIQRFLELFPGIRTVHIVEPATFNLRVLDGQLSEFLEGKDAKTEFYLYRINALELPAELEGRIDIVEDKDVFDTWDDRSFSQSQIDQISQEIRRVLKPFGLHVSAGNFNIQKHSLPSLEPVAHWPLTILSHEPLSIRSAAVVFQKREAASPAQTSVPRAEVRAELMADRKFQLVDPVRTIIRTGVDLLGSLRGKDIKTLSAHLDDLRIEFPLLEKFLMPVAFAAPASAGIYQHLAAQAIEAILRPEGRKVPTPKFLRALNTRSDIKVGFVVGVEMFKKYGPLLAAWQAQYEDQVRFTVVEPENREEASVIHQTAIALSKELPPNQQITVRASAEAAMLAFKSKSFNPTGLGLQADIDLLRKVPGFTPQSQAEMDRIAFGLGVAALLAQFQVELQRAIETAA